MKSPSWWPPSWLRRLRGRKIPRLTGVSLPLGGLQWEYPASEREKIAALFDYLESRRALWIPFDSEDYGYVIDSVLAIRTRLSALQESLAERSPARDQVRGMRFAAERFLSDAKPGARMLIFYSNLGELRGVLGVHLERLADAYGIKAEPPLSWIFPSTHLEALPGRVRPSGEIEREMYLEGPSDQGTRS